MKVLALNPPFLPNYSRGQRSPAVTKSGTLYYPIWLAYATGTVEKAGHSVRLIDAPATGASLDEVVRVADAFQPDLVAIDTSTPSVENDARVADAIKQTCSQSLVGLVGPHVSAVPAETLNDYPWLDFVGVQEYDETLRDLADSLDRGGDGWKEVPGIARREDGKVVSTAPRQWMQDLDAQPFVSEVYKRHLDYKRYFYAITQWPVVTIVSGRGCPYKCNYCLFPQTLQGHQYRTRSPGHVVEELAYIQREFPGVREVFIEDDTLTLHRRRTVEICEEVIRRGLRIAWTCNARADVDYETLKVMKAANCRLMCVGIESGDQKVLDNVQKGIQLEQIEQFFKDAKRAGILVHGCFMAGNVGETRETMEKTLDLAKRLNPDTAQFFPLMVYPGTAAYEWARAENLIKARTYSDWLTKDGLHNTVVDRPDLPHDEVVRFCNRARREFYLRSTYVRYKLRQVLRHPGEFRRLAKSLRTFAGYLLSK